MDELFQLARLAFRRLHGLAGEDPGHPTVADPARLFARARQHRVLGLLESGLSLSARLDAPLGATWQRAVFGQARHTTRGIAEAERLWLMRPATLSSLVLIKGPALAVQAWPDASLRSFDDLDFRCRREDYDALSRFLQEAGYQPELPDTRANEHLWHLGWGLSFSHPEGFMVECNHRFFPPHFPWPNRLSTDTGFLFEDCPLDHAGIKAPTPGAHLLISCLHAVWHGWERLAWCVDIAGLLVRHPGCLEAATLLLQQRDGFARRALLAGVGMAARIFGRDLPGIGSVPDAGDETMAAGDALLFRDEQAVDSTRQRAYHRRMMDAAETARYEWRRITTPGKSDVLALPLPRWARPFYWPARPLRAVFMRPGTEPEHPTR